MEEPIRFAIAGAGAIVRSEHVPRFRAIDGVELVGVANRTYESSKRAALELGLERAYRDWGELVEDPDVDAVLVGTWPYLHAPIAIAALENGKHVLTEARMAADASAAAEMVEASAAHPGQVAMVVPASFSLWADRAIGRLLADGTIGRLKAVRVSWDAGTGNDPGGHWRWQRRLSGTNTMALGIVYEAMARWLGPAEWVSAETRIVEPRKPGADGRLVPTDVADHVLAIAGFPGDVVAGIEMSTVSLREAGSRAVFVGTDAQLEADFNAERLIVRRTGSAAEEVDIPADERDEWRCERDFVAAIRGEATVELTDFATGRRYMEFVDAVDHSARLGERITIGY